MKRLKKLFSNLAVWLGVLAFLFALGACTDDSSNDDDDDDNRYTPPPPTQEDVKLDTPVLQLRADDTTDATNVTYYVVNRAIITAQTGFQKFQLLTCATESGDYIDGALPFNADGEVTIQKSSSEQFIKVRAVSNTNDLSTLSGVKKVAALGAATVKTFTVAFQFNKPDGAKDPIVDIPPQTVERAGHATEPTKPVLPGYIFECWMPEPDSKDDFDFSGTTITEDKILYACWGRDPAAVFISINERDKALELNYEAGKNDEDLRIRNLFGGNPVLKASASSASEWSIMGASGDGLALIDEKSGDTFATIKWCTTRYIMTVSGDGAALLTFENGSNPKKTKVISLDLTATKDVTTNEIDCLDLWGEAIDPALVVAFADQKDGVNENVYIEMPDEFGQPFLGTQEDTLDYIDSKELIYDSSKMTIVPGGDEDCDIVLDINSALGEGWTIAVSEGAGSTLSATNGVYDSDEGTLTIKGGAATTSIKVGLTKEGYEAHECVIKVRAPKEGLYLTVETKGSDEVSYVAILNETEALVMKGAYLFEGVEVPSGYTKVGTAGSSPDTMILAIDEGIKSSVTATDVTVGDKSEGMVKIAAASSDEVLLSLTFGSKVYYAYTETSDGKEFSRPRLMEKGTLRVDGGALKLDSLTLDGSFGAANTLVGGKDDATDNSKFYFDEKNEATNNVMLLYGGKNSPTYTVLVPYELGYPDPDGTTFTLINGGTGGKVIYYVHLCIENGAIAINRAIRSGVEKITSARNFIFYDDSAYDGKAVLSISDELSDDKGTILKDLGPLPAGVTKFGSSESADTVKVELLSKDLLVGGMDVDLLKLSISDDSTTATIELDSSVTGGTGLLKLSNGSYDGRAIVDSMASTDTDNPNGQCSIVPAVSDVLSISGGKLKLGNDAIDDCSGTLVEDHDPSNLTEFSAGRGYDSQLYIEYNSNGTYTIYTPKVNNPKTGLFVVTSGGPSVDYLLQYGLFVRSKNNKTVICRDYSVVEGNIIMTRGVMKAEGSFLKLKPSEDEDNDLDLVFAGKIIEKSFIEGESDHKLSDTAGSKAWKLVGNGKNDSDVFDGDDLIASISFQSDPNGLGDSFLIFLLRAGEANITITDGSDETQLRLVIPENKKDATLTVTSSGK